MSVSADLRRGPRRPSSGREDQGARELRLAHTLLRGEREAAGELWDHFSPLVRALLIRAVGPEPDIEDAMQEIFLRVFHKGKSLRDPALLRSYVVAVTVHYIRSEFRKRARHSQQLQRGQRASTGGAVGNPAAPLAIRALYRALERLPAEERLAFVLRFFEAADIVEGAALARVSVATFKRRLLAAKKRLWTLTGEDPVLAPYLSSGDGHDGVSHKSSRGRKATAKPPASSRRTS
jgi:RNA polymerase sigma-70 factor (ECF subfamily)